LFPGETECVRIGSSCPAGEWPSDLPDTGVLYVRADEGSGGSGTREDPFLRVQTALDAAEGGTVALGKGTHDEELQIDGDVRMVGACAAETILTSSRAASGYGVVEATEGRVEMVDLTVRGPGRQGIRFSGNARGDLQGVRIENTVLVALGIYGSAEVEARNLLIRNTQPNAEGVGGRGISMEEGARLTLDRGHIARSHSEGIAVLGSTAEMTDVLVQGTKLAGQAGDGLAASFGATVEADGLVAENNEAFGVFATREEAEVHLRDSIVRDNGDTGMQIGPRATASLSRVRVQGNQGTGAVVAQASLRLEDVLSQGNGGRGFVAQMQGDLQLARAVVSNNTGTGVLVASQSADSAASLSAEDARFRRNGGPAVQVQGGGTVSLKRVRSAESWGTGLVFRDEGTDVTASDVQVAEPRPIDGADPLEDFARGLEVRVGAEATFDRVRIERAHQQGIFGERASVTARDVTVLQTQGPDELRRELGRGIELNQCDSTVERARLVRNGGVGLFVHGGQATLRDVLIRETRGTGTMRVSGDGIVANRGAQVDLRRAQLERNRAVSLAAFGGETSLTAADVTISETLERDCASDVCPDFSAGIGAGVYLGSEVTLERFRIADSALVGLQLAEGALSLRSGLVARNPVGINIQPQGTDLRDLVQDVAFMDNGQNVDATQLPVPSPVAPGPSGAE
jgi:hypothetical protein